MSQSIVAARYSNSDQAGQRCPADESEVTDLTHDQNGSSLASLELARGVSFFDPDSWNFLRLRLLIDESSKRAEVALRADSLECTTERPGEPRESICGSRECGDLERDGPVWCHARGECLLALFGMAGQGPVCETPSGRLVDHRDDAAGCR